MYPSFRQPVANSRITIAKEIELLEKLDLSNSVSIQSVHTVAGVDLAYWKEGNDEYANADNHYRVNPFS